MYPNRKSVSKAWFLDVRGPGKLSPRVGRKRRTASDCPKQARSRAQELLVTVASEKLRLRVEDIVGPHVKIVSVQNVSVRTRKIRRRRIAQRRARRNQLEKILCLWRQTAVWVRRCGTIRRRRDLIAWELRPALKVCWYGASCRP